MTKDEAITVIIKAWYTNALAFHPNCPTPQMYEIAQAISVLKDGH